MSRILLQNLTVYDGTGSAPFQGDILLENDRILQVEKASSTVFSCVEKYILPPSCSISPGWIDVHAHSDISLLVSPEAAYGKLSQGITTEISGNCGLSAFPILSGEVKEHLEELYKAYDPVLDWSDFSSYADAFDRTEPALNLLFLCGHNTLRASVSGYQDRILTEKDLLVMKELLHKQLSEGAGGFSTGLLYTPGCFSREEELLELLRITAAHGKVHATHLRNEGDRLEEALDEALSLTERSGCALQISHLKTALARNHHKLSSVLEKIRLARQNQLKVHADRYPYTYSQTSLSLVLPEPFDTMDDRSIRDTLRRDASLYQQTLFRLRGSKRDWNKVILSSTHAQAYLRFRGKTIAEASRMSGLSAEELVMDLLREDSPGTMGAFGGLSEENLKTILRQEYVCCGSDETARNVDFSQGTSHPRAFGSMVRFIRMSREQKIPMEEIIRRLTLLPAQIFGLKNRGIIAPGMKADLTLFREDHLRDKADFFNPHATCEGIEEVFVNGVKVSGGKRTGGVLRQKSF